MPITLVLVSGDPEFVGEWRNAFADSEIVKVTLPEDPAATQAVGAMVFAPPPGSLARYEHLAVVFNLGAGVDALIADPSVPNVPIVRLENADMKDLMCEYVVYHALRLHRAFAKAELQQMEARWSLMAAAAPARHRSVTVLGLGRLGGAVAQALRGIGFDVRGWSKSVKELQGIPCYAGRSALERLLQTTEMLVCVLPLTDETRGLLDATVFSLLPERALLISVSRAGCLNETDLLAALDSGQVAHATLDCFEPEPLPERHPFWKHPGVTVTPHMAADPLATACVDEILANVERLVAGHPLRGVVDRGRGY